MVINVGKKVNMPDEQTLKEVGMRIRNLRNSRDFTREVLAEKTGLSVQAISKIEDGERNFKILSLISISRALEVDTDYLLGLSKYNEEKNILSMLSSLSHEEVDFFKTIIGAYQSLRK